MAAPPHARRLRRPLLAALAATAACGVGVCFVAAPTWGHALQRARMASVAMAQEGPDVASYQAGEPVEAVFFGDKEWHPATVEKVNDDGTMVVRWEEVGRMPETSPCQAGDVKKLEPRTPLSGLKPGDRLKGTVVGSRKFGVLVDVNAERDGLLRSPPPKTGPFEKFDRVSAVHPLDEAWCSGVIAKDNGDGTFLVLWDDPFGGLASHSVHSDNIAHGKTRFKAGDELEVWVAHITKTTLGLSLSAPPDLAPMRGVDPEEWLEGTVASVANFGLFVSVRPPGGGEPLRGLVHVSRIREGFVADPRQEAEVGQGVRVRVVAVDEERGQLILSMRSGGEEQSPKPNLELMLGVGPDEWLEGTVEAVASFGLFVSVRPPGGGEAQKGLVHISQIRDGVVEDVGLEAEVGQGVRVRVVDVDMERGKMSLSMRSDDA